MQIKLSGLNFLDYRDTPWDTNSFGFKTREILGIKYSKPDNLIRLLKIYNQLNEEQGIKFTYTRVSSEDKELRKALFNDHYYSAETTILIQKTDVRKYDFSSRAKVIIVLQDAGPDDIEQIKKIAFQDFRHGRFHEDPFIDDKLANHRFSNWVEDLLTQDAEIMVYKTDVNVHAFFIYKTDNAKAELTLAAVNPESSIIAVPFWGAVLARLKDLGVKEIYTTISAANTGVMNLYSYFGFKFYQTLFGMHKFYR